MINPHKNNPRSFGKDIYNYPSKKHNEDNNNKDKDKDKDKENLSNNSSKNSLNMSLSYTTSQSTKRKIVPYQLTKPLKCDIPYKSNPQYLTEYINDIFKDIFLNNHINKPEWGHFEIIQDEITPKMRSILIDWLLEVHCKYNLNNETLYLCVIILDRYLSKTKATKNRLQLIGVTCLFIASKYEDISPPLIRDLVYVTKNTVTREEIIAMEREIMTVLDYDIMTTYSYTILQRLHLMSEMPMEVFHFGQYLLEVAFFDNEFLLVNDFHKALSALYMAKVLSKKKERFPEVIQEMITGNKEEIQRFCINAIQTVKYLLHIELNACQMKFRKELYSKVGLFAF